MDQQDYKRAVSLMGGVLNTLDLINVVSINKFQDDASEVGTDATSVAILYSNSVHPQNRDLNYKEYSLYQVAVSASGLNDAAAYMTGLVEKALIERKVISRTDQQKNTQSVALMREVLHTLDLIGEVDINKFQEESTELHEQILYWAETATNPDITLADADYDLYNLAVVTYGLNKAASFMAGMVKTSLTELEMTNTLKALGGST